MKQEFENISNNLDVSNKAFDEFNLNAPIDEILENVFIDIKFKFIIIINSNFTRIHSNAFYGTSNYAEGYWYYYWDFTSKLSNSPPNYDLYEAFSSLVNAR